MNNEGVCCLPRLLRAARVSAPAASARRLVVTETLLASH